MRRRRFMNGDENEDLVELLEPHRPPNMTSDVWVPAMTALIAAVMLAVLVAYGLYPTHQWPKGMTFTVVFCMSYLVTFTTGISASRESQVRRSVHRLPAAYAGPSGGPEPEDRIIFAQPYSPDKRLPEPDTPEGRYMQQLEAFVRGCSINSTMLYWERKIGRDKYMQMRNTLIRLGAAEWIDPDVPTRGWRLLGEPDDIIQQIFSR